MANFAANNIKNGNNNMNNRTINGNNEVAPSNTSTEDGNGAKKELPQEPQYQPSQWLYPDVDLLGLNQNGEPVAFIGMSEIEEKQRRIIDVFGSFGIQIKNIKAMPGPTTTLYELILAPNNRITTVRKNEEDLISFLNVYKGVRILAPTIGKDSIGVEIANDNPTPVYLREIISSKEFQESTMELPIALGKTFGNKNVIVDLADIPHLLVAGATGQGKTVALHDIIISLLYKKSPDELKFVLIDTKRIEFDAYKPIAKTYMALQQNNIGPSIKGKNKEAVNTIEGLCLLVNERLNLFKQAGVRNIREYNRLYNRKNQKVASHSFMPYIVVIIDEYGDLKMHLGLKIETPIVRLAQLGHTVGIHLVIATQQVAAKVLTCLIKANFPGRLAFRVALRTESRIVLDETGAECVCGHGEALYQKGSTLIRIQCPFVDISEIEKVASFIGGNMLPANH